MKKRLLSLLLCAVTALSFGACGNSNTNDTENSQSGTNATETPTVTALASYDDLSKVLTGNYEINDGSFTEFFHYFLYDAGVGLEEVKDRDTVQEGDIVCVDYVGYLDGEAFTGGSAEDQWIDVDNNCSVDISTGYVGSSYIEGFTSGLVGAKVGEKTSSDVTFPENYSEPLAGKLTTFEFTVNGIYKEVSKESITDEFVVEHFQKSCNVSTVEEFLAYVREELAYRYAVNYILGNSTVEVPESYLNARLEEYIALFTETYCNGTDIETYLAQYGMTLDAAKAEWAETLNTQIKAETIFGEVAKKEKLTLDEAALESYVAAILATSTGNMDSEALYRSVGAGNAEVGKAYLLSETAVRDFILEKYRASIAE